RRAHWLGAGVDRIQHVTHDVVLERGVEEVIRVEVEAAPLDRRLGGALEEVPCSVAEELGDVHAFDLTLLRRGRRAAGAGLPARSALVEEIGEEVVEEASPSW